MKQQKQRKLLIPPIYFKRVCHPFSYIYINISRNAQLKTYRHTFHTHINLIHKKINFNLEIYKNFKINVNKIFYKNQLSVKREKSLFIYLYYGIRPIKLQWVLTPAVTSRGFNLIETSLTRTIHINAMTVIQKIFLKKQLYFDYLRAVVRIIFNNFLFHKSYQNN